MHRLDRVPWAVTGMPRGAFMTLCALDKQEGEQEAEMTVSQLANMRCISKAAVSQILRTLENDGFVERHPRAGDRRVVCVGLTPAGKAVVSKAKTAFEDMMSRVLQAMGEEDAHQLGCLLERFCTILETVDEEVCQQTRQAKEENCEDILDT